VNAIYEHLRTRLASSIKRPTPSKKRDSWPVTAFYYSRPTHTEYASIYGFVCWGLKVVGGRRRMDGWGRGAFLAVWFIAESLGYGPPASPVFWLLRRVP